MAENYEEYKDEQSADSVQTGAFLTRDGEQIKLTYSAYDGADICEGDIVLREYDPSAIVPKAMGIQSIGALWPGCIIPYEIDANAFKQNVINEAIKYINENTDLIMLPRTNETAYVRFIGSDGNSSPVGRTGSRQDIRLSNSINVGVAVHEILHSAGLWHEQSRTDRDNYVTINWANIEAGKEHNFQRHDSDGFDINTYDYSSIMHYARNSFGINTIVPKNPTANIGQRDGMSTLDKLGLIALYAKECEGPFTGITVITSSIANPTPPTGFVRLRQDLNEGAGGQYIFICLQKGTGANVITDIAIIMGDNSSISAPAGYTKISTNLNMGAGGKYIYLCYKRYPGAAPITNITLISGNSSVLNSYAVGYTIIPQDLNKGAGGKYIYLCYKKKSTLCVADVTVISGNNSNINPPAGFIRLNVDLNKGAGGAYIYLCYRPGVPGYSGVSDMRVITGNTSNVSPPAGFQKINIDLNKGAGGKYIYLCKKMGTAAFSEVGVVSGTSANIFPPAGWNKINVDVNMGAGGDYIYICNKALGQKEDAGEIGPIEPILETGCTILETGAKFTNIGDAINAVPTGGGSRTIKLHEHMTYKSGISITDKTVLFDLNGKSLNIVTGVNGSNGIYLSHAHINLLNPANGELNVMSPQYGVFAINSSTAEITNSSGYVKSTDGSGSGGGIRVEGGSNVTIHDSILAPSGSSYIYLESIVKRQAQSTSPTTKTGYITYTDGRNIVWANAKAIGNNYVVNKQAYESRRGIIHHEMHRLTCPNLPSWKNQFKDGLHTSPEAAIEAARSSYNSPVNGIIDGCYICCNEVHTM